MHEYKYENKTRRANKTQNLTIQLSWFMEVLPIGGFFSNEN